MASGDSDGKFIAYPTLFPKDPKDQSDNPDKWIQLEGDAAWEEAIKRGEVFEFDTEEESVQFAKGSWKPKGPAAAPAENPAGAQTAYQKKQEVSRSEHGLDLPDTRAQTEPLRYRLPTEDDYRLSKAKRDIQKTIDRSGLDLTDPAIALQLRDQDREEAEYIMGDGPVQLPKTYNYAPSNGVQVLRAQSEEWKSLDKGSTEEFVLRHISQNAPLKKALKENAEKADLLREDILNSGQVMYEQTFEELSDLTQRKVEAEAAKYELIKTVNMLKQNGAPQEQIDEIEAAIKNQLNPGIEDLAAQVYNTQNDLYEYNRLMGDVSSDLQGRTEILAKEISNNTVGNLPRLATSLVAAVDGALRAPERFIYDAILSSGGDVPESLKAFAIYGQAQHDMEDIGMAAMWKMGQDASEWMSTPVDQRDEFGKGTVRLTGQVMGQLVQMTAATALAGPTAGMAVGAALSADEMMMTAMDAGIPYADASRLAAVYAPIGTMLEYWGASKAISALGKKQLQKYIVDQVLSGAIKIEGKSIKAAIGKYVKENGKDLALGTLEEALTEASQFELQDLMQKGYDKLVKDGATKFNSPDFLTEEWKKALGENTAGGGYGGFLITAITSILGGRKRTFGQMKETLSNEKGFEILRKDLELYYDKNGVDESIKLEGLQQLNDLREVVKFIPKKLTTENQMRFTNLMMEATKLERDMDGANAAVRARGKTRAAELQLEMDDILGIKREPGKTSNQPKIDDKAEPVKKKKPIKKTTKDEAQKSIESDIENDPSREGEMPDLTDENVSKRQSQLDAEKENARDLAAKEADADSDEFIDDNIDDDADADDADADEFIDDDIDDDIDDEPSSVTASDGWTFVRMEDGSYTDGDQTYDSWEQLKETGKAEDLGLKQSTPEREAQQRAEEIVQDRASEIEEATKFKDELDVWNFFNDEGLKRMGYDSPMEMSEQDREILAGLVRKGVEDYNAGSMKNVAEANAILDESIKKKKADEKASKKDLPSKKDNKAETDTEVREQEEVTKKVETLRAEEQTELSEAIPNIDEARVDGKVDRSKLSDSDKKKFDAIYQKYDKLISPLLEAKKKTDGKVENKADTKTDGDPKPDKPVQTEGKTDKNPIAEKVTKAVKGGNLEKSTEALSEGLSSTKAPKAKVVKTKRGKNAKRQPAPPKSTEAVKKIFDVVQRIKDEIFGSQEIVPSQIMQDIQYETEQKIIKDPGNTEAHLQEMSDKIRDQYDTILDEIKTSLSEAYMDQTLQQSSLSQMDRLISENLGKNSISREDFIRNSNATNITFNLAKTWFAKKGEKIVSDIAKLADNISEGEGDTGTEAVQVDGNDIVDFMIANPNGISRTPGQVAIDELMGELTGKKFNKLSAQAQIKKDDAKKAEAKANEPVPDTPFQVRTKAATDVIKTRRKGVSEFIGNSIKQLLEAIKVPVVYDQEAFNEAAAKVSAEMGIPVDTNKVKGFYWNGKVYINPQAATRDTAIHEFAHIYIEHMKATNYDLYNEANQLMKETAIFQEIKNNPAYAHLTEYEKRDEALVQAIGMRGAKNLSKALGSKAMVDKFTAWIEKMKAYLGETFFMQKTESIDKMTLDEFLDGAIFDLLGGQELGVKLTPEEGGPIDPNSLSPNGKALFQFVGSNANLNNEVKEKLGRAQLLENNLNPGIKDGAEYIRGLTGWARGTDGKWKYEVQPPMFNTEAFEALATQKLFGTETVSITEVISPYEEIFKLYPALLDIKISKKGGFMDFGGLQGSYNSETKVLQVTPYAQDKGSTFIHELQHAIQMIEGFAMGGNPQSVIASLPASKQNELSTSAITATRKDLLDVSDSKKVTQDVLNKFQTDEAFRNELSDLTLLFRQKKKETEELYDLNKKERPDENGYLTDEIQKLQREERVAKDNLNALIQGNFGTEKLGSYDASTELMYFSSQSEDANLGKPVSLVLQEALETLDGRRDFLLAEIETLKSEELTSEKTAIISKRVPSDVAHKLYQSLAGETEARNVQNRAAMSPRQRKETPPSATENYGDGSPISREEQIILFGNQGTSQEVRAYHGTPFLFDKFNSDKIGTGEGAQAFGYGLYFTSKKEIAQDYATTLSRKIQDTKNWEIKSKDGDPLDFDYNEREALDQVFESNLMNASPRLKADYIKRAEYFEKKWAEGAKNDPNKESSTHKKAAAFAKIVPLIKSGEVKPWTIGGGQVYHTTIHKGKEPSEYEYLEWKNALPEDQLRRILEVPDPNSVAVDVSNSEQGDYEALGYEIYFDTNDGKTYAAEPDLHEVLMEHFNEQYDLDNDTDKLVELLTDADLFSGAFLYFTLTKYMSPQQASMRLTHKGIDGIRYPVGTLSMGIPKPRNKEYTDANYVVFDDRNVEIDKVEAESKPLFQVGFNEHAEIKAIIELLQSQGFTNEEIIAALEAEGYNGAEAMAVMTFGDLLGDQVIQAFEGIDMQSVTLPDTQESTEANTRYASKIATALGKAFPGLKVSFDFSEFKEQVEALGDEYAGQQVIVSMDGNIYFNPATITPKETFKTFAKAWILPAMQNRPELLHQVKEMMEGTKYLAEAKKRKSRNPYLDALTDAIADKALEVDKQPDNFRKKFRKFLSTAFNQFTKPLIASGMWSGKLNAKEIENLTLEGFTQKVAEELTMNQALSPHLRAMFDGKLRNENLYKEFMTVNMSRDFMKIRASIVMAMQGGADPAAITRFVVDKLGMDEKLADVLMGRVQREIDFLNESGMTIPLSKTEGFETFTSFRQAFQDGDIWLKKIQQSIEKLKGKNLPDALNAYTKRELVRSKTAEQIDALKTYIYGADPGTTFQISGRSTVFEKRKQNKASLNGRMKKKGLTLTDLSQFMYALHVPERNARLRDMSIKKQEEKVAQLTAKMENAETTRGQQFYAAQIEAIENNEVELYRIVEEGARMSDKDAQAILDSYDGKRKDLDEFAQEFREEVLEKNLDILYENDFIDEKQYQALLNGDKTGSDIEWSNYMPVVIDPAFFNSKSKKKGGSTSPDILAAEGRGSYTSEQVYDPLNQAVVNLAKTIEKVEKNNANRALVELARQNADPSVWKVHTARGIPDIDPDTGDIISYNDLVPDNVKTNSVKVRMPGGKIVYLEVRHEGLYNALIPSNRKTGKWEGKIIKGFGAMTNFQRSLITSLNIFFGVPNFARDTQDVLANLGVEKDRYDLKGIRRAYLANLRIAGPTIAKNYFGATDQGGDMMQYLSEARAEGMYMSWANYGQIQDQVDSLKKLGEKSKANKGTNMAKETLHAMMDTALGINEVFEMSNRLAVYASLRDAGLSPQQAAGAAKNISLNFEKKGSQMTILNSMYLFLNAGIQGVAKTGQLLKSKSGRKALAAAASFAYLNKMLLYSMMDEEDELKMMTESPMDWTQNTYIYNPVEPTKPFKIPKSYSFLRLFMSMGEAAYDLQSGRITPARAFFNQLHSVQMVVDPVSGNQANWVSAFLPVLASQSAEVSMNKDYKMSPIYPKFTIGKADHEIYHKSTNEAYIEGAQQLYDKMGVSISPETFDYIMNEVFGGIAQEAVRIATFDKEGSVNQMPLVRRFVEDLDDETYRYTMTLYNYIEKIPQERITEKEQKLVHYSYLKEVVNPDKPGINRTAQKALEDMMAKKYEVDITQKTWELALEKGPGVKVALERAAAKKIRDEERKAKRDLSIQKMKDENAKK